MRKFIFLAGFTVFTAFADHECIQGNITSWPSYRPPDTIQVRYGLRAGEPSSFLNIRMTIIFDPGDCNAGTCSHCESIGQTVPTFRGSTVQCTANDVLTLDKRNYLLSTIMLQAQAFLQSVLLVYPVFGNLIVPGPSQGSTCGPSPGVWVPPTDTTTGIPNTDMVIYVTAAPSPSTTDSTVAWASACRYDQNGRPVAAQVNFVPRRLSNAIFLDPIQTALDVQVGIHEMVHALGYAAPFFSSKGYLDLGGTFQPGGTAIFSERGNTVTKMTSPRVLEAARNYFGCSVLNGVELENQGGPGTAGSHWEKRILGPEAMTGMITSPRVYVSNITLAFFEDTGLYHVNYSKAQPLTWGKGKGCDFAMKACNDSSVQNLDEFCFGTTQNSHCNQDRTAIGPCSILDLADSCPFVSYYSNHICIDNITKDTQDIYGNSYSDSSRCFDSTLLDSRYTSSNTLANRCFPVVCTPQGTLALYVKETKVNCPSDGTAGPADLSPLHGAYTGYIHCPAATQFCQVVPATPSSLAPSTPLPPTSAPTPTLSPTQTPTQTSAPIPTAPRPTSSSAAVSVMAGWPPLILALALASYYF